ncbi:MAG: RsmE family RNA methyltransferase [Balneolaceae bacterium]|nr:RsmE family RNA methyltransferase [Balneolaceae bacterium]
MNLFFADPKDIQHKSLIIRGQEAEHIIKVLRHSVGDVIFVTDGKRKKYECIIRDFKKSMVFLDILDIEESMQSPAVILCMGVIKKRDRLEFAVEKAVELGVSKIILFKGEHSQKGNVREDRLESTAISAMKQSLRFHLPQIIIENSLEESVSNHSDNYHIIVADETKAEFDECTFNRDKNYFLIVGPEGGFSKSEREFLKSIKAEYYSLGKKRLRTETAAVVMVDRFVNQK